MSNSIQQNSVSFTTGHNQFKDENIHPKVFRGVNIGASYTHTNTTKNISEYSAGLNLSLTNTAYENFPSAPGILLHANYKYLFPVITNTKIKYFIGPLSDFQYGTNVYFNWDESHLYYANYLCEGLSNKINYKPGKYTLVLNLDFPLISVISRPKPNRQYKMDDMSFIGIIKNLASKPEFALPDKNFYVKTGIELHFKTKKIKNRSIGFNVMYHRMKANDGKPLQNINQTISYKHIF